MRHRVKKNQHFNAKDKDHAKSLVRRLLTDLCLHKGLVTTEKRAKAIQGEIDNLVNVVNTKDKMNAIRYIKAILYTKESSIELFENIAPKYKDLKSGMTRITAIKYRIGDNAKLVKIEFV